MAACTRICFVIDSSEISNCQAIRCIVYVIVFASSVLICDLVVNHDDSLMS